jgi:hypothetical protein
MLGLEMQVSLESACLRGIPRLAGPVLAALTLLSPGVARALGDKDLETARAVFVEASKLAEQGRWDEARERYRLSLRLRPAAITFYSLGVVDREIGRLVEAREAFRAFLTQPSAPATMGYEEPARKAIAEIDVAIASSHQEDAASPPPRDPPSLTAPVPPVAAAPPVAAPAIAPAPMAPVAAPLAGPDRTLPLILIAAGSGLFVAGVVTGLVGLEQAGNATSAMDAIAESARTKGFVGDIVAGAGLATAGVGVVVLLLDRRPAPAKAASVRPWFAGTSAGVKIAF